MYARVEAEHAGHSFADDARLRAAELHAALAEELKDVAAHPKQPPVTVPEGDAVQAAQLHATQSDELLAGMVDHYPSGDQGGEALFRLGFHALRAGRLDDARKWLDKELQTYPREDGWWEAGRTLYWLGRVADKQGHADEARDRFVRAARDYPLSYYALQALNRLRERWPEDEKKLVESLRPVEKTLEKDGAWRFAPRPLFGQPGFLRGVELARLGLGAEAKREFAALGIKVDRAARANARDSGDDELLWLAAVLYDRAGQWAQSHEIPRHGLTTYSREWPVGDNRKRWLLSYPHAFADLVVANADKNGQPAALEFAIIREESAFDPTMESFANAVGLTQLTPPPAKRFAKGLPYSREALKDPVINVTIGARELGDLWQREHGAAALAIAGYNAGEGAVHRWLKAATAGTTLDEFVETIPYDETRGYTKRVLSSFFAYHWLYDGGDPVPSLPPGIPSR
jgi:soluble lytic murein transglycosylase